ncbi:MAG: FKBP-type peptidyl-prolyl cis-trans isomerase [Acetivibrio ethanolgignens]
MKKKLLLLAALLCTSMALSGCGSKKTTQIKTDYNLDKCITLGTYSGIEKEAVGDTVKEGDTVNIDFVGKKDGEAFEGGTGNSDLMIGSGQFIPGFEEGLIGVKIGDTVDLDLTFPEEYPNNPELAGQAVVFTVTVNSIVEDEDAVWKTAIENATVKEYPESEMENAYTNMENYYKNMAGYYQMEYADFLAQLSTSEDTFREDLKEAAQASVKEKLVALAIVETEGLEISDKEYEEKTAEYVKNYGFESKEAMIKAVTEEALMEQMLMEKARQFVLDNAVTK